VNEPGLEIIPRASNSIRNKNTRAAYVTAVAQFCGWCQDNGLQLSTIRPLHVSAYIEMKSQSLTAPSVKQHLAALRGFFNWLVIKQVVPDNPALFVKGPKFGRQVGITPIKTGLSRVGRTESRKGE
jgi:site-specific recombinase XerD